MYDYWDKSLYSGAEPLTQNYWSADGGATVADISFDAGDGVAIDNPNGNAFNIKNSGEVYTNTVEIAAVEGLNWSGNPFPESISIQAVQLDDDGAGNVGWGDVMQIVGPLGNASAMYDYWDKSLYAGAEPLTQNYWSADGGATVADVTLTQGAGFAIDNPNGNNFTIKIACPFTL